MRDRNVIHLDRLGDQSDHATDYRYGVIRGVQCLGHRGRRVKLLPRVP